MMTSEISGEFNFESRTHQPNPNRPNLLKLASADSQYTTTSRPRKKNRFKFKERSASSIREKFLDDPAYTEDVSHLALPQRRNSGPESEFFKLKKLDSFRKLKTSSLKKRQKSPNDTNDLNPFVLPNRRALNKNQESSSSETLDNMRSSRRGQSLDRYGETIEILKKTNWFQRDIRTSGGGQTVEKTNKRDKRDSKKSSKKDKSAEIQKQYNKSYSNEDVDENDGQTMQHQRSSRSRQKQMHKQNFSAESTINNQSQSDDLTPDEQLSIYQSDDMLNSPYYKTKDNILDDRQILKQKDSKFQIGKRFLRGEIGIKSFNYYLLKEGLKSSKKSLSKQKSEPITMLVPEKARSEENIYEEIFFTDKQTTIQTTGTIIPSQSIPAKLQQHTQELQLQQQQQQHLYGSTQKNHHQSQQHLPSNLHYQPDCELCLQQQCSNENCDVCKYNYGGGHHGGGGGGGGGGIIIDTIPKRRDSIKYYTIGNDGGELNMKNNGGAKMNPLYNETENMRKNSTTNVLQFQSYNPNNPGVYKIETTPVAFTSDYNPIQQHIQQQQQLQQQQLQAQHHQQQQQQQQQQQSHYQSLNFNPYANPNNIIIDNVMSRNGGVYEVIRGKSSSSSDSLHHKNSRRSKNDYGGSAYAKPKGYTMKPHEYIGPTKIYKTDSRISLGSEFSMKSENSTKYQRPGEMSDSSLGDSMFSYPAQRRYFGSAESCRFGFECRRCSYDGEKCSFSDTCRYECKNCDCSSSYFSSDFDDNPNHHTRKNSHRNSQENNYARVDSRTSRYAEDFIKHVNNVKKNNLYQTIPGQERHYEELDAVKTEVRKNHSGIQNYARPDTLARTKLYQSMDGKKSGTLPKFLPNSYKRDDDRLNEFMDENLKKFYSLKLSKEANIELKNNFKKKSENNPNGGNGGNKKTTGTVPKTTSTSSNDKDNQYHSPSELNATVNRMENNEKLYASPNRAAKNKSSENKKYATIRKDNIIPQLSLPPQLPPANNPSTKTTTGGVGGGKLNENNSQQIDEKTGESKTMDEKNKIQVPQPKRRPSLKDIDWDEFDEGDDDVFVSDTSTAGKCPTKQSASNTNTTTPPTLGTATITSSLNIVQQSTMNTVTNTTIVKPMPVYATSTKQHSIKAAQNPTAMPVHVLATQSNDAAVRMSQQNQQHNQQQQQLQQQQQQQQQNQQYKDKQNLNVEEKQQQDQPNIRSIEAQLKTQQHGKINDDEENNDYDDDDDDSVFVAAGNGNIHVDDKNKTKESKIEEKKLKEEVVYSQQINSKNSPNEISCDLEVAGDTSNRDQNQPPTKEQQPKHKASNESNQYGKKDGIKGSKDSLNFDKSEILDFPLPEIPVKKTKRHSSRNRDQTKESSSHKSSKSSHTRSSSSDKHKKSSKEKLHNAQHDPQTMHYRNAHDKPPTYLFGENTNTQKSQNPSEILLNKSGWIQVNPGDNPQINSKFNSQQQQYQYTKVTSGYLPTPTRPLRVENYKNISHLDPKTRQALIKQNNQKIEDLISRNDARKIIQSKNEQDQYYGRPGFLPVKNYKDRDSPPPVTPILSPPPAFQDTKGKLRSAASNVQISVTDYENHNPKGMVFSRSFEYDNRRKNIEFNEIFSKSFDHDFKTNLMLPENRHIGRQKSMTFSTLTGISPNYLSKRNSFEKTISKLASRSRDNSPMQSRNFLDKPDALVPMRPMPNYLEANPISYPRVEPTSVKNFTKYRSLDEPTNHGGGGSGGRSRRAQFSRVHRESSNSSSGSIKGFRSLDAATNLRLNSCDSGARSDFSNDEEDEDEEQSSSLALSYKSAQQLTTSSPESLRNLNRYQNELTYSNPTSHGLKQKQRSLTPDRIYDDDPNILSHNSLIKQRSLTPEKRSITPEDRIVARNRTRNKNIDGSNSSLISSKHNSNSRNSTLERHQKRYESEMYRRPNNSSRSSSSSSYSGGEQENQTQFKRGQIRQVTRSNAEYRIRRSRSLQLSERSPNRQILNKGDGGRMGPPSTKYPHSNESMRKVRNQNEIYQVPRNVHVSQQNEQQSSRMDHDKSRSFDIDYDKYYNPNNDYDKSRSFDDDYYKDPNSNQYNNAAMHEKKYSKNLTVSNNQIYARGEQQYNRHENVYEVVRRRSPNPESNVVTRSREVSPNNRIYRPIMNRNNLENERGLYHDKSPVDDGVIYSKRGAGGGIIGGGSEYAQPQLVVQANSNLHQREVNSSPGSDFDGNLPDFDVDYDIGSNVVDAELIKEAELVTEFLYGKKYKTESYQTTNQRDRRFTRKVVPPAGTPSSGSCTASSCDFWPHCGLTNINPRNVQIAQSKSSDNSTTIATTTTTNNNNHNNNNVNLIINNTNNTNSDENAFSCCEQSNNKKIIRIGGGCTGGATTATETYISGGSGVGGGGGGGVGGGVGDFDEGCTVGLSWGCTSSDQSGSDNNVVNKKYKTKLNINSNITNNTNNINTANINRLGSSDKLCGKPPPVGDVGRITRSSSIVFLGEREMPITKKREYKTVRDGGSFESTSSQKGSRECLKTSSSSSLYGLKSGDGKSKRIYTKNEQSSKILSKNINSKKMKALNWDSAKYKSRSLPKSFLRGSCSSTDDPADLANLFVPNSPLQMRAVSSPTLSENPTENPFEPDKGTTKIDTPTNNYVDNNNTHSNHHHTGSVLQKFKKTLSHFKGKPPAPITPTNNQNNSTESNESTKHRFGPLVWRTSKERKKTKHQRRDKCNSGDSGIQVEIENDEMLNDGSDSLENSQSVNVRVRRTNSAKTSTESQKGRDVNHASEENKSFTLPPMRSLSQSSGLDRIAKENEDSDSESVSSVNETPDIQFRMYAEVLYPFEPAGQQELRLEKGALIEVIRREPGPWWWGQVKLDAILSKGDHTKDDQDDEHDDDECSKLEGWFPKEFVRVIPPFPPPKTPEEQQDTNHKRNKLVETKICDMRPAQNNSCSSNNFSRNNSNSNLNSHASLYDTTGSTIQLSSASSTTPASSQPQNSRQTRENIVRELLATEINYVKLLASLCLGFVKEMRMRPDIFSNECVNIIFSNIEKIWRFQQTFLDALHTAIEGNRIAECFLEFQSAFMVYSTYCNCYPKALVELDNVSSNREAFVFLENCRINENLPELPLSAHLLAPIQRICRYPLHLSELVKHSPTRQEIYESINSQNGSLKSIDDTIDCKETLESALNAMKRATEMVNEGKRHSEYLSRIQTRFDNFQGQPINVLSTRLFLQTDAIRISPNLWNNTYTLFLFDHQLVYCKKDILKRTQYIYKGRIYLDNCRILNLPDGKLFNVTLKNAMRIYCDTKNKWFNFCFRSSSSKLRFLNTLSAERQFCGESLFVTEIESGADLDSLANDKDYHLDKLMDGNNLQNDDDQDGENYNSSSSEKITSVDSKSKENQSKKQQQFKYNSDTLPKKTRKIAKDINYEYSTSSLGRKKLGNFWFRKAKSTNSTPNHSPTHHHPLSISTAVVNSDSSSQNSPVTNGARTFNNGNVTTANKKEKNGAILTSS